jgi:hypothetical protein
MKFIVKSVTLRETRWPKSAKKPPDLEERILKHQARVQNDLKRRCNRG